MEAFIVLVALVLGLAALVVGLALRAATWTWRGLDAGRAQRRADAMLRELLTESEYAQLGRCGYLEVRSPSRPTRTYRVPRRPGRVAVHEGNIEIESLCVAPVGRLPPGDIVLAHKLMIEGNEHEYLRLANHFRLWPVSWSV